MVFIKEGDKMKDENLNTIGKFWLGYLCDVTMFNKQIDNFTDCDLYTLYAKRKQLNLDLNRLSNVVTNDAIKEQFEKFRHDLMKSINDVIFSKEMREKYEDEQYKR